MSVLSLPLYLWFSEKLADLTPTGYIPRALEETYKLSFSEYLIFNMIKSCWPKVEIESGIYAPIYLFWAYYGQLSKKIIQIMKDELAGDHMPKFSLSLLYLQQIVCHPLVMFMWKLYIQNLH